MDIDRGEMSHTNITGPKGSGNHIDHVKSISNAQKVTCTDGLCLDVNLDTYLIITNQYTFLHVCLNLVDEQVDMFWMGL